MYTDISRHKRIESYTWVVINVVLLAASSARREVGETIGSTDGLKQSRVAHAVIVTGRQEHITPTDRHRTKCKREQHDNIIIKVSV